MLSIYKKYLDLKDRFKGEEEGQGLIEYTLLLVLISVVLITFIQGVAQSLQSVWSDINSALGSAS